MDYKHLKEIDRRRSKYLHRAIMFDEGFLMRKCWRALRYYRDIHGVKLRACTACNGSGYYDNNGSPKCGGCDGTCKEDYRGPKWSVDAFEKENPGLYAEAVRLGIVPRPKVETGDKMKL